MTHDEYTACAITLTAAAERAHAEARAYEQDATIPDAPKLATLARLRADALATGRAALRALVDDAATDAGGKTRKLRGHFLWRAATPAAAALDANASAID